MARKMTREQLEMIVQNFAKQATRKNDYAYTAGYLQSLATTLLSKLSAKEQEHHVNVLLGSDVWNSK